MKKILLALLLCSTLHAQTRLINFTGPDDDRFGRQIIAINDVATNGAGNTPDGLPEILISSIYYNPVGKVRAGLVLYYPSPLNSGGSHYHLGNNEDAYMGERMVNLGDINQDGFDEYAIYERYSDFVDNVGRVRIYSTAGAFSHVRDHTGFEENGYLGREIVALGDLNSNGTADYGIYGSYNGDGRGRVVVYDGNGTLLYAIQGTQAVGHFGYLIANLGDLDDDGSNDFAVAGNDETPIDLSGTPIPELDRAGRVHIISGVDGSVIRVLNGEAETMELGEAMAAISDVDGDGYRDLVVSNDDSTDAFPLGYMRIYSGKTGAIITTLEPEEDTIKDFAVGLVDLGDLTGDGKSEFAVLSYHDGFDLVQILRGSDFSELDSMSSNDVVADYIDYIFSFDYNGDGKKELVLRSNLGEFVSVGVFDLDNISPPQNFSVTGKATKRKSLKIKATLNDDWSECNLQILAAVNKRKLNQGKTTEVYNQAVGQVDELNLLAKKLPGIAGSKKAIFLQYNMLCGTNILATQTIKTGFKRNKSARQVTKKRLIRIIRKKLQ